MQPGIASWLNSIYGLSLLVLYNLVPRAFLRRGEEGPFLSSAEKSPGNEVGFSTQDRGAFLRIRRFLPLLKNQHLVWIDLC